MLSCDENYVHNHTRNYIDQTECHTSLGNAVVTATRHTFAKITYTQC